MSGAGTRLGDRFKLIQQINGELVYYDAKIVSEDPKTDLVILKITDPKFSIFPVIPYSIKFQTSDKGSDVFTIGFPRFERNKGKKIKAA